MHLVASVDLNVCWNIKIKCCSMKEPVVHHPWHCFLIAPSNHLWTGKKSCKIFRPVLQPRPFRFHLSSLFLHRPRSLVKQGHNVLAGVQLSIYRDIMCLLASNYPSIRASVSALRWLSAQISFKADPRDYPHMPSWLWTNRQNPRTINDHPLLQAGELGQTDRQTAHTLFPSLRGW